MSDIHALSGAYAVGGLDDLERREFERHLAVCPTCRDEVDSLCETAALLAETTALEPPAHLRAQVLAAIETVRPLPPVVTSLRREPTSAPGRHAASTAAAPTAADGGSDGDAAADELAARRRPRRWLTAVAAAAAVVAAAAGGTAVVDRLREPETPAVVAVDPVQQVLTAPDAEVFSTAAAGGGSVTVTRSAELDRAVLTTDGLREAPSGKTRELWLKHDNTYIAAGFLDAGTAHSVLLDGDPLSASAFGMTIEPASGSSSPSDQLVALLDFSAT